MKFILFFFLILIGCAHSQLSKEQSPKISTFESNFKNFWSKAKDLSLDSQILLWDRHIEIPNQEFYDSFVWPSKNTPDFASRKKKRLELVFLNYNKNYEKILNQFKQFEHTVEIQLTRFNSVFKDSHFNEQEIIGALAPTFNGRTSHFKSSPDKVVLAFGIDTIVERNDNPDVLYSHELFHIYHTKMSGIRDDGEIPGATITIPLWTEGLATYTSFELNPSATLKDIFMDQKLADLSENYESAIAAEFLKVTDHLVSDTKKPNTYREWFMMNQFFNSKYPSRCGYWLGFRVVKKLRNQFTLSEMAKWDSSKVDSIVRTALHDLANKQ